MTPWHVELHLEPEPQQGSCCFRTPPLQSHCGRFSGVLDGELSNHQAVRRGLRPRTWRSDDPLETVVEGVAQRGAALLPELRGSFSLACWDHQQQRLLLAADRFGVSPLLQVRTSGVLAFASSAAGLEPRQSTSLPAGVLLCSDAMGQQRQLRWWPSWPDHSWEPLPLRSVVQARDLLQRQLERVVDAQLAVLGPQAAVAVLHDHTAASAVLTELLRRRWPGGVDPLTPPSGDELNGWMQALRQNGQIALFAALGAAAPIDGLAAAVQPSLVAARRAGVVLQLPFLDPQLVEITLRLPPALQHPELQFWRRS